MPATWTKALLNWRLVEARASRWGVCMAGEETSGRLTWWWGTVYPVHHTVHFPLCLSFTLFFFWPKIKVVSFWPLCNCLSLVSSHPRQGREHFSAMLCRQKHLHGHLHLQGHLLHNIAITRFFTCTCMFQYLHSIGECYGGSTSHTHKKQWGDHLLCFLGLEFHCNFTCLAHYSCKEESLKACNWYLHNCTKLNISSSKLNICMIADLNICGVHRANAQIIFATIAKS